jgi:hypothetical protein
MARARRDEAIVEDKATVHLDTKRSAISASSCRTMQHHGEHGSTTRSSLT